MKAAPLFPVAPAKLSCGVSRAGTRKRTWVMERKAVARALLEDPMPVGPADELALDGRPRRRADCVDGPRPCPWVGCRYHLGLEATVAGGIQFTRPGGDLEDLPETCALDVAEAGGVTLERLAVLLNMTRERVRQIEGNALVRLRRRAERDWGAG